MPTPPVFAAHNFWAQAAKLLAVALIYFACAKLGLYFPTHDSHITLFWIPTGLAVAVLLRWGSRTIIAGIFAGAFLLDLSVGIALLPALLGALGDTLAPLFAVWLLKRWKFDPALTRQYDLLALIAAACTGTLLPAAIGVASLWLDGQLQPSGMPIAWLNWWLGDMMSILLLGPLLLSLSKNSLAELLQRPAQMLLCGLLLLGAGALLFLADAGFNRLPLAFLPLPLVLWAALRLGVTGAAVSVISLSLLTAVGTATGNGVFGHLPAAEGMYMAWLYMFIVALTGLMATTLQGERKKLEDSLLRANELLRETQTVAKTGSWRLNLSRNELIWSDETYRIFGIPPGTPLHYETFLQLVHPDDRARVDSAWRGALKGEPYRIQHRITVGGETRWVEERAHMDIDAHGKLLSGTGSVQDITDSKGAEQRLLRSETRYKALLQQAADALFVHDFEGRIVEVNQQACDTLGYSADELCRMYVTDVSPVFDLSQRRPLWERLELGCPTCFNSVHKRRDGSTFPVEVRLVVLAVDNEKMIMALASDITERRRIEAELQESEARYRNFAEQLPLGIVITQQGLIKYVNQKSIDMIGYSGDELLDLPFLPLVHEEDRGWLQDLHRRRMAGEKVKTPYVVRMIRKDGEVRQWEMHASTINWKGQISGFGIIADITERIQLEMKLLDSLHLLEEKELAKTRFLAAAGHDLRQPIAAANLFVGALRLNANTERQLELVERLEQSMGIFSNLLERLLDISKFDAGLIKPQFSTFNLAELFNWLEQNFAQPMFEKDLSLRLFFPLDRPLVVRTDIGLIQSVVMNLITNAIKFTARGGILVSARARGNRVLLQIWDTGCGIAETDLPYIFDEFYQANNPQRSREAGLGLGLSICQRAMSLLGGKVSCRSRPGHGSVFSLDLPLQAEHRQIGQTPARPTRRAENAHGQLLCGKRIVLLEDDALVAEGLLYLLQELGARAQHFPSAEEALQHGDTLEADFYIADYALSGKLGGIDFLQTVQRQSPTPLRAVIITGETSSSFIASTRDLPWPVLHKPANLEKLLSNLQQQVAE